MNLFRRQSAASRPAILCTLVLLLASASASASLTVTPLTWNVVGLDSNTPTTGPKNFPVGARVCSDVAVTNVNTAMAWDSANANVDFRSGSLSSITLPAIAAGGCADAYFEVSVNQVGAAYDTARRYHITATDVTGTYSTPAPRELYVEHLVSQSRNGIFDVRYGPDALHLTSVPAGGSMNLVVGNTYTIQLVGGTATQGYNQFEAFINFQNTIFQVLSVSTTYSADDSPYVANPNDRLYADACGWANDPNSPSYRSCAGGDFKAGGSNVVTTYTIKIISGGGTAQSLNTLLYDFSGSSFHYNADYATGARIANIIDPSNAIISKSFNPSTIPPGGVSNLLITLGNPNAGSVTDYNFVDNLPSGVTVASPANATATGCGAPTLTAVAGSGTISFSNGTIAANGSCVVSVNVTSASPGTYVNTTQPLYVETTSTTRTATATLTVDAAASTPGTGLCGLTLAQWNFPSGFSTTAPAVDAGALATASAAIGAGLTPQAAADYAGTVGSASWSTNGDVDASGTTLNTANNDYFQFTVDTTGYTSVELTFKAQRKNSTQSPKGIAVYVDGVATSLNSATAIAGTSWTAFGPVTIPPGGTRVVRIYLFNAGNSNPGSDLNLDNVVFTGCGTAQKPAITKVFSPATVAVNGTSTLTFTLTNPNAVQLTGAKFIDALPSGVVVAPTPNASTTCGGSPSWAPAAGAGTLSFGQTTGATIPASGSCTVSVDVRATTAGPRTNVSDFLSTTESGTTTSSVAAAPLTALLPPSISKQFSASTVVAGGVAKLTFSISNPNPSDALGGVSFTDTMPGGLLVATPSSVSNSCGGTVTSTSGTNVVSLAGGSILGAGVCTVSVDVLAPASTGAINNVTGAVSATINGSPVSGNTAAASITVTAANPKISVYKQVGPTATGPWTTFLSRSVGDAVYYRFTFENTGDVALTNITLSDTLVPAAVVSACNASLSGVTLVVPNPNNDNHLARCVSTQQTAAAGSFTNTATGSGTYAAVGTTVTDTASATYATTGLTLTKNATESYFLTAGAVMHYSYGVTNSGFAPLAGPVTVADDKSTNESCPDLSSVGDGDSYLDAGESIVCTATYTIAAADAAAGWVTNNAVASAGGVSSNTATKTIPLAAIAIAKNTTTPSVLPDGTVSYSITVTNTGQLALSGLQVTDVLPAFGGTYTATVSAPGYGVNGSYTGIAPNTNLLIGTDTLAVGATATINITVTLSGATAGVYGNTASVSTAQVGAVSGSTPVTVTPQADLAMAKSVDNSTPAVGGNVVFTLSVHNNGPSTATGIAVSDALPAGLSYVSDDGGGAYNSGTGVWAVGSLASGATATLHMTAKVTASGTIANTATVSSAVSDPNNGNDQATATLTVASANTPPVAVNDSYITNEDTPLTIAAPGVMSNDTDADGDPLTVAVATGPAHGTLTLNPDGSFSYTPAPNYNGPDSFTYTLSDGKGATATATVTLTVNAVNDPPIAGDDSYSTAEDTPLVIAAPGVMANDSDVDGDPMSVAVASGPTHGTLVLNADGSFTYTPTANYSGADSFTYTVSDGKGGTDTATVNLSVTAVNDPPVAVNDSYSTTKDIALVIAAPGVLVNDSDVDGDALTSTVLAPVTNGTLALNADGSFTYTPNAGYLGGDSFTYTVNDGHGGTATATVSITVAAAPNTPPVANNDSYTTNEDTPLTVVAPGVLGNDTDADLDPLSAAVATGPTHGTVTVNADGSFTYTPTANYSGPDSFTYTVSDGKGGTATGTVTLTVTPVNDPPVAVNDSYTTAEDTALTIVAAGVLGNDTDADLDPLSAAVATGPTHGTVTVNADGSFTYTPTANYSGPDSFTYTLSDGKGGTATGTVNITVTAVNDLPVAIDDSYSTGYNAPLVIAAPGILANDSDVDGDSLTVTGSTSPAHGSIATNADGSFTYTPAPGYSGPDSFTYTISDSHGGSGTAIVAITVTPLPALAATKSATLVIDADGNSTASPGDTLEYAIAIANGGGSAATGVVFSDVPDTSSTVVPGSVTTSQGSVTSSSPAIGVNIGSIAAGTSVTIRFRVVIANPVAAGVTNISNQGQVTSVELPAVSTDDPATPAPGDPTVTSITAAPLLGAAKTAALAVDADGNGVASPGDTLQYTIVIHNSGNGAATNVVFSDTPGANTTIVGGSVTTTAGTIASSSGSVVVNVGTLAGGATATVAFRVAIANPLAAGVTTVSNQGSVTCNELPPVGTDDPTSPAPDDPTVTSVTSAPVVAVTKAAALIGDLDANGFPSPGDTLLYTITITNSGNGAATGVLFSDTPDPNSPLIAGSVQTSAGTVTSNAGSVGVNAGTIAGGAAVTITFRVTVASPLPAGVSSISNQGQVSGTNIPATPTDDPSTVPPGDPTITTVTALPRVTALKSSTLTVDADGTGTPSAGDTLTYTVTVSNNGNTDATAVVFADTPGANTSLIAGSVTTSLGAVSSGNAAGDSSVSVNVGSIGAGGSATVSFRVVIANPLPAGVATVSNQAVVSGTNFPPVTTDDPTTTPADDPTVTAVGPAAKPQLHAAKTSAIAVDVNGDGIANPGDTLQYTIVLDNSGTAAATGVAVLDTPGANTSLVAGSVTTTLGTVTTGNAPGASTVRVDAGTLAAGGSCTVILRVVIVSPLAAGVTAVSNQGAVTSNEGTTTTDDPSTPAPGDPTVVPVAPPAVPPAAPDLAVAKTVDSVQPAEGSPIRFTIRVTNNGLAAAAGVAVNESFPAGLHFAAASATAGSYDATTRIWQVGVLNAGATATLTLTAQAAAGTAGHTLTNCVALAVGDPNPANDQSCVTVTPRDISQAACSNQPPLLSVPSLATAAIGSTLRFRVAAVDPEREPVTLSAAGLPSHATFDAATGEFTFTPSDSCTPEDEAYEPTFMATDARGASSAVPVFITVARAYQPRMREVSRHAPRLVPLPLISTPQGVIGDEEGPVAFRVVAQSQDAGCAAPVSLIDVSLGNFDPLTGLFTWSATGVSNAVSVVRFKATDCSGRSATASVPVRLGNAATPASLTAVRKIVFGSTPAGENRGSATVSISNHGGSDVTVQSVRFENGGSFRLEGALRLPMTIAPSHSVDVRLLFEPREAGNMSDRLIVTAGPGTLSIDVEGTALPPTEIATITTNEVPFSPNLGYVDRGVIVEPGPANEGACASAAPVLSVPSLAVAEIGRQLRFRVAAIDPDGDAVSLGVSSLPPGAFFDTKSGVFTFTPPDDCGARASRIYAITFVATDAGGARSSAPVQITTMAAGSGLNTSVPLISAPVTSLTASSSQPLRFRVAAEAGADCKVTLSRAGIAEGRYNAETGEYVFAASAGTEGAMGIPFVATSCDGSQASAMVQISFGDASRATVGDAVRSVEFSPAASGSRNGYVTVPVVNHSNKPLAVTGVSLTTGADFAIDGAQGLPLVLRPGHELPVRIEFQPRHSGKLSDQLVVTTSDPQTPRLTIELSGEGVN